MNKIMSLLILTSCLTGFASGMNGTFNEFLALHQNQHSLSEQDLLHGWLNENGYQNIHENEENEDVMELPSMDELENDIFQEEDSANDPANDWPNNEQDGMMEQVNFSNDFDIANIEQVNNNLPLSPQGFQTQALGHNTQPQNMPYDEQRAIQERIQQIDEAEPYGEEEREEEEHNPQVNESNKHTVRKSRPPARFSPTICEELRRLIVEIRGKHGRVGEKVFIGMLSKFDNTIFWKTIVANIIKNDTQIFRGSPTDEDLSKYEERFEEIVKKTSELRKKVLRQEEEARRQKEEERRQAKEEERQQKEEERKQTNAPFVEAFNNLKMFDDKKLQDTNSEELQKAMLEACLKTLNEPQNYKNYENIEPNDLPKYFNTALKIASKYAKIRSEKRQSTTEDNSRILRESYVQAFFPSLSDKDKAAIAAAIAAANTFWNNAKPLDSEEHKRMRLISNFTHHISKSINSNRLKTIFKEHFGIAPEKELAINYLQGNLPGWVESF